MRLRSLAGVALAVVCAQASAACSEQDWKTVLRGSEQAIVEYARQHHCDLNQGLDNGASSAMVYAIQSGRPGGGGLVGGRRGCERGCLRRQDAAVLRGGGAQCAGGWLLLEHGADVNVSTRFRRCRC